MNLLKVTETPDSSYGPHQCSPHVEGVLLHSLHRLGQPFLGLLFSVHL